MDETLRGQIKDNLSTRETDDLVNIWKQQNTDEWEPVTFEIIKEILLERLGKIPVFDDVDTSDEEIPPNKENEVDFIHSEWIKLVDINFSNSEANDLIDLALEYAEDEDFDLAIQSIEKAVPLISETAPELTLLGEVWLAVNKPHEAYIVFEEAIKLDQEYSRPRTGRRNALVLIYEEPLQPNFRIYPEEVTAVDEKVLEFSNLDFEQNQNTIEETPDWVYMSLESVLIRGSAGFRNRSGRSGLDPLDSQMDEARFEGLLIRRLFTGHLRTHDPLCLITMFVVGSLFLLPLLFMAGTRYLFEYTVELLLKSFGFFPLIAEGLMVYYNIVLSFLSDEPEGFEDTNDKFF